MIRIELGKLQTRLHSIYLYSDERCRLEPVPEWNGTIFAVLPGWDELGEPVLGIID